MSLRVAISGSGMRSRMAWQRHVRDLDGLELVGVHDVSRDSLQKAVDEGLVAEPATYTDLERMLEETAPDVLIACPIIAAHASAVEAGLRAGCHVLVEKPFTDRLGDACALTRLAKENDLRLGVVQNWRTKSMGDRLHSLIAEGVIGDVSHVFFRYLRDRERPHLPDYLYDEPDPLLYAMGIHHFDLFRYVLGREIVSVESHTALPAWSKYRQPSIFQAWLELEGGIVVSYTGTFSSRNAHLPQESLQVEGELGTLHNESAYGEPPLMLSLRDAPELVDATADVEVRDNAGQNDLADVRILTNFRDAVLRGEPLIAPADDNCGTLAAIEAAALSWREGRAIDPRDVLREAESEHSSVNA